MSFLRELQLKRHEIEDEDRYPYNIPAVRGLDKLTLHPGVTYFIGENGSGKSTFIEAIAILAGFNAEGGSKHFLSLIHI
jgi:predicted ATPase